MIALIRVWRQIKGGSYIAENENWPIFMAENGNIAFISMDIIFESQKTDIIYIIVTDIKNHRYYEHPPP